MINNETHTIDWILDLRNKLGKRIDPKLIEKVIWALTLLEQLKIKGLNFTFKGGTALLLATEKPKRFSIDIDIITEYSEKEITAVLQKIVDEQIFLDWEDDNDRTFGTVSGASGLSCARGGSRSSSEPVCASWGAPGAGRCVESNTLRCHSLR